MREPEEFLIIQNLQQALQGLVKVANGYFYDLADAVVKLDPNQGIESYVAPDGRRPFVVIEVQPESREYAKASRVTLTIPVLIHWVNDSDPTNDSNRLQVFYRGCADVEKAIVSDFSRGGHAVDTKIMSCSNLRPSGNVDSSLVWAQIETQIVTHRKYGQPTC
jgi:hypothetical protein